jgi:hypothetical protein
LADLGRDHRQVYIGVQVSPFEAAL